jgi:hypothetical protein
MHLHTRRMRVEASATESKSLAARSLAAATSLWRGAGVRYRELRAVWSKLWRRRVL